MTFYIIDRRYNAIVNAVETDSLERAAQVIDGMTDSGFLIADPNPPRYMLERYRYWNERP